MARRLLTRVGAAAVSVLVSTAGLGQQSCADPLAGADAAVAAWRDESGDPSVAVAVGRGGRVVWETASGWADVERRVPATPSTPYSLASISKPITATAIILLVERGLLALDTPVNDLIPDAPLTSPGRTGSDATVRHLLSHTSGLPLHHHFFDRTRGHRPPPMAETIARYGFLVTAPGERFQYSNLGYGILDDLVERLARQSFGAFLDEAVFAPLGMVDASLGPPPGRHAAVRYGSGGRRLPYYDFDHRGGSAVFASVRDLVRFGLAHLGDAAEGTTLPVARETLRLMQEVAPGTMAEAGRGYGLGWQVGKQGSRLLVSHGGGMPGVSTQLTLDATSGLVVAVVVNASSSTLPQRIVAELLARHPMPTGLGRSSGVGGGPQTGESRPGRASGAPRGLWRGFVRADDADRPLAVRVEGPARADVCLDGQAPARLVGMRTAADEIIGFSAAQLVTADTAGVPHLLRVELRGGDRTLAGVVTAVARDEDHPGFALSHWVELERVDEADEDAAGC